MSTLVMVKDEDLGYVLTCAEIISRRFGYEDWGNIVYKYRDQPVNFILAQVKGRAKQFWSRRRILERLVEPTANKSCPEEPVDLADFLDHVILIDDRRIFQLWLDGYDPTEEGYSRRYTESVLDRCMLRLTIAYRELDGCEFS